YTYNKLYSFHTSLEILDLDPFMYYMYARRSRLPLFLLSEPHELSDLSESILPDDRLTIRKIQVASPGFWEFFGSLNPLQQIREYLNDRHKRRQDREYREKSEAEKL